MGLKMLKPSLSTKPPRLGYLPNDVVAADLSRNRMSPWRQWYKTKRWQQLRHEVFLRDAYRCQRSGDLAIGRYPAPHSPVANHKIPHRGDPVLFWDINNIETVTKAVHDSLIQSEERKQYP
jgi:5-methylcytosine-specific restriction protein A